MEAANKAQLAVSGLSTTASAFGNDAGKAQAAAKRLTDDGLLPLTTTSSALRNLLAGGLNLDQASRLMDIYKDRAAFGRQSTIGYGQAVDNLAESFLTQSSQVGNLSGMTENYNQIIASGAAQMGKTVAQLNNAETAQAKYLGTIALSNGSVGDAARYAETYAGAQAKLEAATTNAHIAIGQALQPAVANLQQGFLSLVTGGLGATQEGMQQLQGTALTLATELRLVGDFVVGLGRTIASAFSANPLQAIGDSWKAMGESMTRTWSDFDAGIKKIAKGTADEQIAQGTRAAEQVSAQAQKAAREMARAIADENESYTHSNGLRLRDFEQSMRDMIIAHRDKSRSIQKDLTDENASYQDQVARRQEDYNAAIADLEDKHKEKVSSITEAITAEREKGIYVDGILYSEGNAKKLAKLQESLNKESDAYADDVAKKKAKNDREVADDAKKHQDKLTKLNSALSDETAILNRHRKEVAAVGEAQKEDDISRMQRQYAQANAEAGRNHQMQLAKIRERAVEQGVTFGSNVMAAQKTAVEQQTPAFMGAMEKAGRDGGLKFQEGFKQGASSTGQNNNGGSLWSWLTASSKNKSDPLMNFFSSINKFVNESARASGGPVTGGVPYLVGERGPELVIPSQSGTVIPADQTVSMMNQRGASVHIENFHSYSQADINAFAERLSWRLT